MIAVIDYNCGNPRSVINMINRIGEEAILTRDKKKIFEATKVIIPGVGSFDHGMSSLKKFDLHDMLKEIANNGKPILGICLGMQLLGLSSEEGEQEGLGLIDATFHKFNNYNIEIKVPHVGWNDVQIAQNSILFKQKKGIESRFYFVHSYYAKCLYDDDIIGKTTHGIEFVSCFGKKNIFGVQFHPEKSHKFGQDLIRNFLISK